MYSSQEGFTVTQRNMSLKEDVNFIMTNFCMEINFTASQFATWPANQKHYYTMQ